jgi:peptidyl-tRNA hydrolase, PTH1 family
MDADVLLVGLGNPGDEYHRSPHNAGFEVVDRARALCKGPRFSVRGDAAISECRWRGHAVVLLKPQTYMNRSGAAVELWLRRTGLSLDRLVVCYDDLDLPFGQVRLRASGGAGGHHGMESILEHLGSGDFPRIRVGIKDPDVAKVQNVDYLLSPLPEERWSALGESAQLAAEAALSAAVSGFTVAMNRYNRRAAAPKEDAPPDSQKSM